LDNEVKKQDADLLHWDVSYKEAKQFMRFKGKPIFHGLVAALKKYNEICIQYHVYTDGHNQMRAALIAFHTTLNTYGMAPIQVLFTDNPSQNRRFFTANIPGLQAFQDLLDSNSAPTQIQTLPVKR